LKKIISFNQAVRVSLVLLGLLILFHLSILAGILFFDFAPTDYLWGGKMDTKELLLRYEIVSVLISSLFFCIVLIKSRRIYIPKLSTVARYATWVLFAFFILNTIGNLIAATAFEKIFAIVTGILAFLMLRIAIEKN